MKRGLLAMLGVLVGVAALVALVIGALDAVGDRRQGEEAVLYYALTPRSAPLRMEVQRGVKSIRLETLLALDRAVPYVPEATYPYSLEVTLTTQAGQLLWQQDIHLESRRSRAGLEGENWTLANASLRDRSLELADNRLTMLMLPQPSLVRFLRLRMLAGPHQLVCLRLYSRRDLNRFERDLRVQGLGDEATQRLSRFIGFRPWGLLDSRERYAMVSREWLRMGAEGVENEDYETRSVWFSGFTLPPPESGAIGRFWLTPWQDAAVNVRGPGEVTLKRDDELNEQPPLIPETVPKGQAVSVRIVYGNGNVVLRSCGLTEDGAACRVSLDQEGPATLHVRVVPEGWMGVRYRLSNGLGMVLGEHPVLPDDGGTGWTSPDVRTLPLYRSSEELSPLFVEVGGPKGGLFGIIVRAVLPLEEALRPAKVKVSAQVDNTEGRRVWEGSCEVAAVASRYEFYRMPEPDLARVGERMVCYFPYPPGVHRIRIETDELADLQFVERQPWEPEDVPEEVYRWRHVETVVERYPPLFRRRWIPVHPLEEERLWQAGRVPHIGVQVRLELKDHEPETSATTGIARTLLPLHEPPQQELMERVPVEDVSGLKGEPGTLVELPPGQAGSLELPGGPIHVYFRVPPEAVGERLELSVDGESVGKAFVDATVATVTVGRTTAGSHRVKLSGPVGQYFVEGWSSSLNLWRRHRVFELARGQDLEVALEVLGKARFLNAVVYLEGADSGEVLTHLDGGKPRLGGGMWSGPAVEGNRAHPIDAPQTPRPLLLDLADSRVRPGMRFARKLAMPLASGEHRVRYELARGRRAWVRFFVLDEEDPPMIKGRLLKELAE